MKKKIVVIIALILALPVVSNNTCDDHDIILEAAVLKLKDHSFIKSHNVYIKKSKNGEGHKYVQMVLNRGVSYKFILIDSDQFEGKLMLNIYNNMRRDYVFASNYSQTLKKRYTVFEFTCKSTINACLDLYFQDGNKGCAIAIAGFKKP